jgi:enamine deaminase RidA (YjgF/YER057c/UK114 family)
MKKVIKNLGVPWEKGFGYVQGVQVADTVFISGQLSHDDNGNLVAPAPVDADGRVTDFSNMGAQMQQTYANCAKMLSLFGLTMDNVVQEVVYVLNMQAAFDVGTPIRKKAFNSEQPEITSTILETPRLAFPEQLIEISMIAMA